MVMTLQINNTWMVLNKQQHRYLYLYTFLIMKWDMIMRRKPNSFNQDQNMVFPMT